MVAAGIQNESRNAQSAGKTKQFDWTQTVKNYETNKQVSIEFSAYIWKTNSDFNFKIYLTIDILLV